MTIVSALVSVITTLSPSAHPHQVPITDSGYFSALMVPIRVGDKIYRALVDTGSPESLISSRLTTEASVVGRVSTQDGELAIKLSSWDMPASGDESSKLDIVIGMDVLANQIVEIDLKNRNLRFLGESKNGTSKPVDKSVRSYRTKRLKFRRDEDLRPVADFEIEGQIREFAIDTGSNQTAITRGDLPASFCIRVTTFDGRDLEGHSLVALRLQDEATFAIVGSWDSANVLSLNQLTNTYARFDFRAGILDYVPYKKNERSAFILSQIMCVPSLDGITFGSSSAPTFVWQGSKLESKQKILQQIQGLTNKSVASVREKIPEWRATAMFNFPSEKSIIPRDDESLEPTSPPPAYEAIKGYCWTWLPGNGWSEHRRDSGCKERSRCWPYTAADLESGKWPLYGLAILSPSGQELAMRPGRNIFPPGTTFKYIHPKLIKTDAASGHHTVLIPKQ